MSKKDKPDFLDWLRLWRRAMGMDELPPAIIAIAAFTWSIIALTLLLGIYKIVWDTIWQSAPSGPIETWNWRFSLAQLGALTAVLGAVIALPLTMTRLVLTRRQTETAEQGQITDRINKAVEGLGAEKTVSRLGRNRTYVHLHLRETAFEWKDERLEFPEGATIPQDPTEQPIEKWENTTLTQPNLEVRIGAIYALERIAQDSDRDHVQIMEILCAYIRQNAPAPQTDDWPRLEMKPGEEDGPLEADWEERVKKFREDQEEAKARLQPREDIQVALTVIGRRSAEQRQIEAGPGRGQKAEFPFDIPCPEYAGPDDGHDPAALESYRKKLDAWKGALDTYGRYRLDLHNTDLRGMDLSKLNFHGARLDRARLQGAVLVSARLHGANLGMAQLQGAVLDGTHLQGAYLVGSRLQGAFLWGAKLQGTVLRKVQFGPTTILAPAALRGATVRLADYTNVPQISDHLPGMFGDASVTLPGGHGPEHESWPKHWPKVALEPGKFQDEWRKWQADPEGYLPPDLS